MGVLWLLRVILSAMCTLLLAGRIDRQLVAKCSDHHQVGEKRELSCLSAAGDKTALPLPPVTSQSAGAAKGRKGLQKEQP